MAYNASSTRLIFASTSSATGATPGLTIILNSSFGRGVCT
jgi:hypothetical protein